MPTSALFADNTFAGDERYARFALKLRAQHAAEWRQVLDIFERARDRGAAAPETLEFIRDQLDKLAAKQPEALALKMVRPNVGISIRLVNEGTHSAEQRLDFLLDQTRRELAAAIAHSPR